jgi:hypothetical protein
MSEKKEKPTCYHCRQDIIFDKNIVSPKGIQIPLDPSTKKPHECPKPEPEQTKNNQTFDEAAKEIKSAGGIKSEYVDHTIVIGKLSEVKIFSKNSPVELEKEYREFQIGNKFVW